MESKNLLGSKLNKKYSRTDEVLDATIDKLLILRNELILRNRIVFFIVCSLLGLGIALTVLSLLFSFSTRDLISLIPAIASVSLGALSILTLNSLKKSDKKTDEVTKQINSFLEAKHKLEKIENSKNSEEVEEAKKELDEILFSKGKS